MSNKIKVTVCAACAHVCTTDDRGVDVDWKHWTCLAPQDVHPVTGKLRYRLCEGKNRGGCADWERR